MEIKDIIKTKRIELGYTLDDLGRRVGVTGATVSRWESGDIENMKRDKIANLAEALHISPAVLMGWKDEEIGASPHSLDNIYLSFAKEAQDEGIEPEDIRDALDLIKKLRGEK